MNSQLKTDKIEGEIKSHEAEELKKAMERKLKKVREQPMLKRIKFIMDHSTKINWSAVEMTEVLKEKDLLGSTDVLEIADLLNESFKQK